MSSKWRSRCAWLSHPRLTEREAAPDAVRLDHLAEQHNRPTRTR